LKTSWNKAHHPPKTSRVHAYISVRKREWIKGVRGVGKKAPQIRYYFTGAGGKVFLTKTLQVSFTLQRGE
jgi:hypothetical protein